MKIFIKILLAGAALLMFACGTYQTVLIDLESDNDLSEKLAGKSICVLPFTGEFSSSRFVIDLRGISLSINGQKVTLSKKYLKKDDDPRLGNIGILEVNPIGKQNGDIDLVTKAARLMFINALKNDTPYKGTWAIGLGLGQGNSGLITNRPMSIENSAFGPKFIIDEESPHPGYFSLVEAADPGDAKDYDLNLLAYIDISNEVVEIISPPDSPSGMDFLGEGPLIEPGQYYLAVYARILWKIVDSHTNDVIAEPDTDIGYEVYFPITGDYLLPIANGDAKAFENWFENADMTEYAIQAVYASVVHSAPIFTPFNVYTTKVVEVEK